MVPWNSSAGGSAGSYWMGRPGAGGHQTLDLLARDPFKARPAPDAFEQRLEVGRTALVQFQADFVRMVPQDEGQEPAEAFVAGGSPVVAGLASPAGSSSGSVAVGSRHTGLLGCGFDGQAYRTIGAARRVCKRKGRFCPKNAGFFGRGDTGGLGPPGRFPAARPVGPRPS